MFTFQYKMYIDSWTDLCSQSDLVATHFCSTYYKTHGGHINSVLLPSNIGLWKVKPQTKKNEMHSSNMTLSARASHKATSVLYPNYILEVTRTKYDSFL